MAQQSVRVNLNSNSFPFLSEFSGRGIFVKSVDQNFIAAATSSGKSEESKDTGIPALYYGHNIMATEQGFEAIDFQEVTAAVNTGFIGVFPVYEASGGGKAFIGYTASGDFYYSADPYYAWNLIGNFPTWAGKSITVAYINGITYFYVYKVGCSKFNFSTHTFTSVTLTGLEAANIIGIVAVLGYLIAWTEDYIAWSSLIDPTDFTPSLATGAGGGSVQGAKGNIVTCISHTTGFMVYTNQNAVSAPASGNTRYPFNFREIVASGGIANKDLVTFDALSGNHYAYSTSGMQTISLQAATPIFPELTDFLAGSVFEDFDEASNTFEVTRLTDVMKKRLVLISDRYLVISYGITSFTHALIYDTAHKRWGKFKIPHVAVFEFSLLTAETVETPRRSIAFLQSNGTVQVVRIDVRNTESSGVALLGKYQVSRARVTTLETAVIENKIPGGTLSCDTLYTPVGKDQVIKAGTVLQSDSLSATFGFHATGVNHSLLIKGAFNLVCLVINTTFHGRR